MSSPVKIDFSVRRSQRQEFNNRKTAGYLSDPEMTLEFLIRKDENGRDRCSRLKILRLLVEEYAAADDIVELGIHAWKDESAKRAWGLLHDWCMRDGRNSRMTGRYLAVLTSRQCKLDETFIFTECNYYAETQGCSTRIIFEKKKLGNKIYPCPESSELSLYKTGKLKSMDGRIEQHGVIKGYVFHKNIQGEGGSQDSTYDFETTEFAEWVKNFADSSLTWIIALDTNNDSKLRDIALKYEDTEHVKVVDNVGLRVLLVSL